MDEACPLGLAPSTSTTAMLGLGDALSLVLSRMRNFQAADFARFHPGGSLGRKLAKVEDVMRPLSACRVADSAKPMREVLVQVRRPGRRSGCILFTDRGGRLAGVFTDSDLSRLLEQKREAELDRPARFLMTPHPTIVALGTRLSVALEKLTDHKLSELPVIDANGRPLGLIDITDVVDLHERAAEDATVPASPAREHIAPRRAA
jgi:arabinose-5-phosphate isomerase